MTYDSVNPSLTITTAYFANSANVYQRLLRCLFLFLSTVSLLFLHLRLFLGRLGLRLYFLLSSGHGDGDDD